MELDVLPKPKTEVGSYFVANYPPFSVWTPEHKPEILAALDSPLKKRFQRRDAGSDVRRRAGSIVEESGSSEYLRTAVIDDNAAAQTPLGLYLHIPFCRKRCKFCYFRVYTDKNAGEIESYLDALGDEIALYSKHGGFAGRQFEFVYFGGGTPSYLSNAQLERMVERINEHWNWSAAREVTFECEPGTLKESKLQTIKKIGVTRLSLGVEHFDEEILSINGRAHKAAEIGRAFQWAREVGFPQINIDLIAGMLGETEDKWKYAVEKALALDPDSLTVYQMEVPYNTGIAKDAREHGGVSEVASWAQKRAWVDYAFNQFQAAGYVVSSAYTVVKPERHAGFVYRDSLWHGADMVATGVASFGHFQGVHYQNYDKWEQYLESLQAGELPINRALPVREHQLMIREMILQLKTGQIDAGYYRKKFGEEILSEFREGFEAMVEEGAATIDGDHVTLTRPGLLRVDTLLPRFFEPQFQNIRYT